MITSIAIWESNLRAGMAHDRGVHCDSVCRARAADFLRQLVGWLPADLSWDHRHRLQGHGHVCGRELVVIASRDDRHMPVVLTAEDWDAIKVADGASRRKLLEACAITDHDRLEELLCAAA